MLGAAQTACRGCDGDLRKPKAQFGFAIGPQIRARCDAVDAFSPRSSK